MKKIILSLFFLFTASWLSAQWKFELTLSSRFLDRGFDVFYQNKPALQPSITYSFGESGLSVNLWGSFAFSQFSEFRELQEIDLTINYDRQIAPFTISLGFINYGWYFAKEFSFKNNTTQEFYLGVSLDQFWLKPHLTAYYDINLGDGLYIEGGLEKEFSLNEKLSLLLNLWQGYNNGQWQVKKGFADLNIRADLELQSGKVTYALFAWFSKIFNEEINPDKKELLFGIILKF